jgi:glycosyltransferase involved in cell wall biosynthesis
MKILQIIYTLGPGGAERFTLDLSNELSRQGHDVTLCILRDDSQDNFGFYKHEVSQNLNYVNLNIPVGFKLNNIVIFYKLIKKLNPEIVHCHLNLVNYLFPLAIIFPKIKFLNTIHSNPKSEVKSSIEYWIRRFFYSSLRMKAITISEETSRYFLDYYKTPPFKEIYNGRALPKPTGEYSNVKNVLQKYKDDGNTVFLHIGSCNAAKNQELLIGAFNKLVQNGDRIVLMIIGSGFDSEEGRRLKIMACDRIFFLGEKHNVSDYLLNADAFCLSSVREGMPISLIEAFACGCVPICTPIGGLINTIKNGETGYLSKSFTETDYCYAIRSFLENKTHIKKEDLIQYYFTNFSIEECVKKYLLLYETQEVKQMIKSTSSDVNQMVQ